MLKKVCPQCGQASYSASEFGLWLCPYCGANLRYERAVLAGTIKEDKTKCFWCDGEMETSGDYLVCKQCEWRYRGIKNE